MIETTYIKITENVMPHGLQHMLWINVEVPRPNYTSNDPSIMLLQINAFEIEFKNQIAHFESKMVLLPEILKQFKGRSEVEFGVHRHTVFAEFKADLMMLKLAITG